MNKKIAFTATSTTGSRKRRFCPRTSTSPRLLSTGRSKRQGNCVVCAQQICTTYCLKSKDSPMQGLSLCTWEKYYGKRKTALRGVSASTRITKVAIYIRVSTIHQVDKDSIPMQKKDLIAYCQLILGTDNYEIFEDAGYSGKNTESSSFPRYDGKDPEKASSLMFLFGKLIEYPEIFWTLQKCTKNFNHCVLPS